MTKFSHVKKLYQAGHIELVQDHMPLFVCENYRDNTRISGLFLLAQNPEHETVNLELASIQASKYPLVGAQKPSLGVLGGYWKRQAILILNLKS